MSELSDYKRCVSGPLEASLRATILNEKAARQSAEAKLEAVRGWLERLAGVEGEGGEMVWTGTGWLPFRQVARQALASLDKEKAGA